MSLFFMVSLMIFDDEFNSLGFEIVYISFHSDDPNF